MTEVEFEDRVKQQMLDSLKKSLEAIATELSILLYQKMKKTPIAWAQARKIVTEIFNRGLVDKNGW
ncbi:MAG: hypothetical protein Greene101449_196 [Candidatus Peregrinibacteria bacterium Greene1014_49]|nr:MAG: hypothetical protein Greene101449_196 [Candidatus Peregrinibacteria bacterium Greene1014_49]